MFTNCSIMVIPADATLGILRIETDSVTQEAICNAFSSAVTDLVENKTRIVFDGSYKPNRDEFLAIENFHVPDQIKDAVRNPLGIGAYQKIDGEFPDIKAIFIGQRFETDDAEKFMIAFQRFRKEQYISTKWYNLFFKKEAFFREKDFGISISDNIDCNYVESELQFSSFYFARQVFDLSEYYRSATDQEVDSFATNERLRIENPEAFKTTANTWIRRKIAMINDSEVLANYSALKIKNLAKTVGIEIAVENKKVIIPDDKEKIKVILGFLDEEAYKGPFSQNTFLANSKRPITK